MAASPPSSTASSRVTYRHVADIARRITDWKGLLPYLNLEETHEEEIKECEKSEQRRALLKVWRREKGKNATYGAFIKAAKEACDENLADFVEELLEIQPEEKQKSMPREGAALEDSGLYLTRVLSAEIDRLQQTMCNSQEPKLPLPPMLQCKLPLQWRERTPLPSQMESAQAVYNLGKVYVGGGKEVSDDEGYRVLEYCDNKWAEIRTKVRQFGLAVIHEQVIITGGEDKGDPSNRVWVLEGHKFKYKLDIYPNMNIARISPSAIGYKSWVVVVAGRREQSVEVFDTCKKTWYMASTPRGGLVSPRPSLTVIQDTLYMVQGRSALSVYLPILLSNAISQRHDDSKPSRWQELPDTITHEPALTSFEHNLLAVGAWDNPDKTIAMYIPQTKQWLKVATLHTARQACSCIEIPTKIMVMGGASSNVVETYCT